MFAAAATALRMTEIAGRPDVAAVHDRRLHTNRTVAPLRMTPTVMAGISLLAGAEIGHTGGWMARAAKRRSA